MAEARETTTAVERFERTLLSLPELGLRVRWLGDRLTHWPAARSARVLNELCERSEQSHPRARRALLPVALWLATTGPTPLTEGLRTCAQAERLFGLARVLDWRTPGVSLAPPPRTEGVPDYGTGRELTVGERRTLARRPTRDTIEKLLMDPHPLVIRQLLENPGLVEEDVLRLATARPARGDVLDVLVGCTHWLCRSRVRLAIVLNPGAPPHLTMPLLAVCDRSGLKEVALTSTVPPLLRATAREYLHKRPPLARPDDADAVLQ